MAEEDGRSLGAVTSELLADAMAGRRRRAAKTTPFVWPVCAMHALVSVDDKGALYAALDADRS